MGTTTRCVIAATCLAIASLARAAAPSIADFAADEDSGFMRPALSPDGTKVALIARTQDKRVLFVVDLVKRVRTGVTVATIESFDISFCRFKGDERLLCGLRGTQFIEGQPYPVSRLVAVDVVGTPKPLVLFQSHLSQNNTHAASQYQDRILDYRVNDPKRVLIELSDERGPWPAVYSLDVYDGTTTLVQHSLARSVSTSWGIRSRALPSRCCSM